MRTEPDITKVIEILLSDDKTKVSLEYYPVFIDGYKYSNALNPGICLCFMIEEVGHIIDIIQIWNQEFWNDSNGYYDFKILLDKYFLGVLSKNFTEVYDNLVVKIQLQKTQEKERLQDTANIIFDSILRDNNES